MQYDLKGATNDYGPMDYGAARALVENILLAATAEGLGSVVHIPVKKSRRRSGRRRRTRCTGTGGDTGKEKI